MTGRKNQAQEPDLKIGHYKGEAVQLQAAKLEARGNSYNTGDSLPLKNGDSEEGAAMVRHANPRYNPVD